MTLRFQDEPLAVYQGSVEIEGRLRRKVAGDPSIARLRLTVQACDDEQCLKPADLVLEVAQVGGAPTREASAPALLPRLPGSPAAWVAATLAMLALLVWPAVRWIRG